MSMVAYNKYIYTMYMHNHWCLVKFVLFMFILTQGALLKPHVAVLVPTLLESVSSLEIQVGLNVCV